MRFGKKMALWAFCAVPAAAAMMTAGTGVANAAAAHPGPPVVSHGPHCDPWQRVLWDVNGKTTVNLTYNNSRFTYAVTLRQDGSCVGGTLTDAGLPTGHQTLHVSGVIDKNHITFSVNYGATSIQGTRTFTGDINRWGTCPDTGRRPARRLATGPGLRSIRRTPPAGGTTGGPSTRAGARSGAANQAAGRGMRA